MHFARHAAAEIGQEVEAGLAHVVERHVALQRRIQLVPSEDVAEIADAGRRERLDRAGGDGVDADVLAAEIDGEVANARLERRLGP